MQLDQIEITSTLLKNKNSQSENVKALWAAQLNIDQLIFIDDGFNYFLFLSSHG